MRQIVNCAALAACLCLGACAGQADRFYTLNILPGGARAGLTPPTVHVLLSVDVPALVDRPEMVVNTSDNGIAVLDHERWAVPLSEQVFQTLARDLERRRTDVLVADRAFDQAAAPPVKVKVDIVRLSAQPAQRVVMEAHWRIVDATAGSDVIGGDVFDSAVAGAGYDAIARAYSEVLGSLADRLSAGIVRAR